MKLKDLIRIKRARRNLKKAASLLGKITFTDATFAETMIGVTAIHLINDATCNVDQLLEQ